MVSQMEQMPTTLPLTTPLKYKPPTGKTVVFLDVEGSDQIAVLGQAVQAATKVLGWNYKQLTFDQTSPSSLVSAMTEALQFKPVGVVVVGNAESQWASMLPAYSKAGASIVFFGGPPTPPQAPVIVNMLGVADYQTTGKAVGDWFVVNSGGHGNVLLARVDDIPAVKAGADSFQAEVEKYCQSCHIDSVQVPLQAGLSDQGNPAVVSALQRHPNDTYLFESEGGFFTGMPTALAAAGLSSKIKVMSVAGSVASESDVQKGTEEVTVGQNSGVGGWFAVDSMARHLEGMAVPADGGGTVFALLVKGGAYTPSENFDYPANYAQIMESLWHVGS